MLGGGTDADGAIPLFARRRADTAYGLLSEGTIDVLVLSGRYSIEAQPKSEARSFHDYLVTAGADATRLILEERSRDTIGNAVYSKEIVLSSGVAPSIHLVTSDFHMRRALAVFRYVFGDGYTIVPVASRTSLANRIRTFLRESALLAATHRLLQKARPGDHSAIEALMLRNVEPYLGDG